MIQKISLFSIQNKNTRDLDNVSEKYPALDELMTEQNISSREAKTVHRRRDLDSLG